MKLVELHAQAMGLAVEVVDGVRPDQLDRPTPCAGWTLRRLLEHCVGQHQGFAAAARGAGPDLALFADAPLGADPAEDFRRTGAELTAAFREAAVTGRALWLPEVRDGGPFPLAQAVGFHLVDALVHAWDVAAALGGTDRLVAVVEGDDALATALLAVTEAVPDTPEARAPGRAFRPGLEPAGGAGRFDRALALLGRDPAWKA
ncbi:MULTISPECIES: TIGR03086 family metal-binding protein [Kitasatospora]|uniref:TIGR03086 family metal-binding protein n=1 Tax=Kitasatospora cathayae TaxID=3004092 RepID=A0ABY7Q638_9ACTN|nr:TIGR03086 family metal-binding protein [Kitasatospora sp. HUAS 3-15]WBP87726.1 TIGR03086 family metal-binding protein [Kitasatospora sp. HUAS 3-15]